MNSIKKWLVKLILPKIPFIGKLEGYKTQIGLAVSLVSWVLAAAQAVFPEYAFVSLATPYISAALGWIITEVGLTDKELRGKIDIK